MIAPRALAASLLAWSLSAGGMVIDPVDPAFGVAIVEIQSNLGPGAHQLHGLAATPSGGVAALVSQGQLLADNSVCSVATIVVFASNGRTDPGFGVAGRASAADLGLPPCVATASLGFGVGDDGAFYLVANQFDYPNAPLPPRVWKVTAKGVADTSFAAAGASLPPAVESILRPTVQVLSDGSVAVGGPTILNVQGHRATALAVVRLRSSGLPDTDYGTQGLAFAIPANRPVFEAEGGGMAVNADGTALVAGNIFEDDAGAKIYTDATVARFDAHGALDTAYGDAGFAIPLRDASTYAQSLAVTGGEAYLAGVQGRDVPYAFVTKIKTDGRIDLLFGNAGVAGTDRFNQTDFEPRVAVDAARRLYFVVTDLHGHLRMHRFTSNGQPDTGYGTNGAAYVSADGWDMANHTALAIRNGAPYIGAGPFYASDSVLRMAHGIARLNETGGHRTDIEAGTAVVYYHAALDHFFMTANPAEQVLLDNGTIVGWRRTGDELRVVTSGADAELSPVCRFYGRPEAHLDSHFFSAAPDECAAVAQKFSASWLLETSQAFLVELPNRQTGACPRGSEKVYRAFNNRADANHYYGVSANAPAGWTYEGYGLAYLPTAFCAPLL